MSADYVRALLRGRRPRSAAEAERLVAAAEDRAVARAREAARRRDLVAAAERLAAVAEARREAHRETLEALRADAGRTVPEET